MKENVEATEEVVVTESSKELTSTAEQMNHEPECRSDTMATTPVDMEYKNDMLSAADYSRGHGIPISRSNISETDSHLFGSTYSGMSFASSFDPDNVALHRQPLYSG